jgi:iron complex outermembrane receptor protein
MNFILKEDSAFSTINAGTGVTSEGDGYQYNLDYNTTFPIGNGGRVNMTLAYTDQEKTNRAGTPGVSAIDIDSSRQNEVEFARENPALGMIVGRPDLKQKKYFCKHDAPSRRKF